EAIGEAVDKFLGIEASGGPRGSLEGGEHPKANAKKKSKGGKKSKPHPKPRVKAKPPGSDGLVAAGEAGELEGKSVARKVSGGFPVFYASRLPAEASYVESNSYYH